MQYIPKQLHLLLFLDCVWRHQSDRTRSLRSKYTKNTFAVGAQVHYPFKGREIEWKKTGSEEERKGIKRMGEKYSPK